MLRFASAAGGFGRHRDGGFDRVTRDFVAGAGVGFVLL